jgi:hypothetical protein
MMCTALGFHPDACRFQVLPYLLILIFSLPPSFLIFCLVNDKKIELLCTEIPAVPEAGVWSITLARQEGCGLTA